MIQLVDLPPSKSALAELAKLQGRVDLEKSFASRSARAVALWDRKSSSKAGKAAFAEVKRQLGAMCAQVIRCSYCEDSLGDEIEHIWPKSLFPARAFVWTNYCLACGPCNGPKSNRFALFGSRGHGYRELDTAVEPPKKGKPVLLDPRRDDPLQYLALDVLQTFAFEPRSGLKSRDEARARFTIDVLRLNRDDLCRSRRRAAASYESFLTSYVNATSHERARWRSHIEESEHPTVWYELLRYSARLPAIAALVAAVPEVRTWTVGRAAAPV